MFQHGGLTTLGVNAITMGTPAIVSHYIFRLRGGRESRRRTAVFGFLSGAVALALSVALFLLILLTNLPAELEAGVERSALLALGIAHLPLIVIEGIITSLLAVFLQRVRPRILEGV